jgi:hypothetical protein
LYNLKNDPLETHNLATGAGTTKADGQAELEQLQLDGELQRLQEQTGALPDKMPVNPEMKMELPAQNIR